MARNPQLLLITRPKLSYGGQLLNTRKGRSGPRPLATKYTMHLVLRSSKAKGQWSFRQPKHAAAIKRLTAKFAKKYGVKVLSLANVGNHLHFHIQLGARGAYRPFIRALTGSIAMAVTGVTRWSVSDRSENRAKDEVSSRAENSEERQRLKFWDYRPFTRVVQGFKALLSMRDYIEINQLEGLGVNRWDARVLIAESG